MPRKAVIIGAGITGALTAWRLGRAGWRVTVLEALHVGAGSSSRTAAGIRQQFSTPETVVGMRYSVDFYRRFQELCGGETSPIVQNGYLFLYDREEQWAAARARVGMQHAVGLVEAEALDGPALAERFPWVAQEAVLGASWCPTDGFLRPETVYNDALTAARALGVEVLQGAPVVGAEHDGQGRLSAVSTPGGRHEADMFVDATNAWSPRLGAVLGATPLPIAPLKRYLWFLERAGSLDEATLASMPLTIAPSGAYCRPENRASLLAGWAHDAAPEPAFTPEDQDRVEEAFFHRSGPDSYAFAAWMALAEVIPALAEFSGITATTAGYYATTPDHNPFLDIDPAVPNLLRLVGFSGHGAMFGPFSARVALALAEGGRVPEIELLGQRVPLDAFRIGRGFGAHEALVI